MKVVINILIVVFFVTNNICAQVVDTVFAFTIHKHSRELKCYQNVDSKEFKFVACEILPIPYEHDTGWTVPILGAYMDYLIIEMEVFGRLYVRKGLLAVNTRNYNTSFKLYRSPDLNSEIVDVINTEQTVYIYDKHNSWLFVRALNDNNQKVFGWLEPSMQCPSPLTTCN